MFTSRNSNAVIIVELIWIKKRPRLWDTSHHKSKNNLEIETNIIHALDESVNTAYSVTLDNLETFISLSGDHLIYFSQHLYHMSWNEIHGSTPTQTHVKVTDIHCITLNKSMT